jgi:hypothetical protein
MKKVKFKSFEVSFDGRKATVSATIEENTLSNDELEKIVDGVLKELTGIDITIGSKNIHIDSDVVSGSR